MADELEIFNFTTGLIREAGRLVLNGSQSSENFNEKSNAVDLVTATDKAVESFIKDSILSKYPSHRFIGEESYDDSQTLTSEPTWIVDPIDGTTNFVHSLPFVAISIGFINDKVPKFGLIFNPFLNHLYSAFKDHGAYLTINDSNKLKLPLKPSSKLSLSNSLLAIEWGADRSDRTMPNKLKTFNTLLHEKQILAHGLRSFGACTINCMEVAKGSIDIYFEIGCWAWDVTAAYVILSESGCSIFGKKQSVNNDDTPIDEILFGRKFLFIRNNEGGHQHSKAIANEFYNSIDEWDP